MVTQPTLIMAVSEKGNKDGPGIQKLTITPYPVLLHDRYSRTTHLRSVDDRSSSYIRIGMRCLRLWTTFTRTRGERDRKRFHAGRTERIIGTCKQSWRR